MQKLRLFCAPALLLTLTSTALAAEDDDIPDTRLAIVVEGSKGISKNVVDRLYRRFEALFTGLSGLKVVPADAVKRSLMEAKAKVNADCRAGIVAQQCQVKLGMTLGASHVAAVSITRGDKRCEVDVRVFELASETGVAGFAGSSDCSGDSLSDVASAAVESIAKQMRLDAESQGAGGVSAAEPGAVSPQSVSSTPLRRADGLGALSIKSSPPGATVRVGGRDVGVTPLELGKLKPGVYDVDVRASGYKAYQTRTTVVAGDTTYLEDIALDALPAPLRINSKPAGARIKVDGAELSEVTPASLDVVPGEHEVEVTKDGYASQRVRVTVAALEGGRVLVELVKQTTASAWPVREGSSSPVAGSVRVDPTSGLELVYMPAGEFRYGCAGEDSRCDADEKPARRKRVGAFWMTKTHVTAAAYERCASAGACSRSAHSVGDCNWRNGRDSHPMNCLSWEEAVRFCHWMGGRLPTAVEWEYAAKSGRDVIYPWGNGPVTAQRANSKGTEDGYHYTSPVGSYPAGATPWGLLDMAGNVWSWTASDYDASTKELRGGGWDGQQGDLRASYRLRYVPGVRDVVIGFRCVLL